jgi:hypothetical protein
LIYLVIYILNAKVRKILETKRIIGTFFLSSPHIAYTLSFGEIIPQGPLGTELGNKAH